MELTLVGILKNTRVAVWIEPRPDNHSKNFVAHYTPTITTEAIYNDVPDNGTVVLKDIEIDNEQIIFIRARGVRYRSYECTLQADDLMDGPNMVFIAQMTDGSEGWHNPVEPTISGPRVIIGPYGTKLIAPADWDIT